MFKKVIQGLSHKKYNYKRAMLLIFQNAYVLILYSGVTVSLSFHGLILMTTPAIKINPQYFRHGRTTLEGQLKVSMAMGALKNKENFVKD